MMSVIDISKIEAIKIPAPYERAIKVILAPDTQDDVKDVSLTMGILYPHSKNDLHVHEGTEMLYIVSGFGKAIVGDEEYVIREDSLIIALPGVKHQQINESDETMKMFAIWVPPVSGKEVIERAKIAAGVK